MTNNSRLEGTMHRVTMNLEISFELGERELYDDDATPLDAALCELESLSVSMADGAVEVDCMQIQESIRIEPSDDEW